MTPHLGCQFANRESRPFLLSGGRLTAKSPAFPVGRPFQLCLTALSFGGLRHTSLAPGTGHTCFHQDQGHFGLVVVRATRPGSCLTHSSFPPRCALVSASPVTYLSPAPAYRDKSKLHTEFRFGPRQFWVHVIQGVWLCQA